MLRLILLILHCHLSLPLSQIKKQYDPKFHQKYQQLVGFLMYLMIGSRPDIGFAVVKLALSQMVTYLFVIEELGSFNKSRA